MDNTGFIDKLISSLRSVTKQITTGYKYNKLCAKSMSLRSVLSLKAELSLSC